MANLKLYTGPTKLVVAFDIGTISSSISYCILEQGHVPEVLGALVGGGTRVPSLLYYDEAGQVRAAGAEVSVQTAPDAALTKKWTKTEWWKLHLCPKHLTSSVSRDDDLPSLPPRKSAVDVLTDFIKYLFQCVKTYIEEQHPALPWSSIKDSIEYIITYPNGWEDVRWLYHRAVEHAGLIPSTPEGHSRVYMLTEGEASLHFCVLDLPHVETTIQAVPWGVAVIDAGGGTIDLSMFSITSNLTYCEETAPAECRLQGAIFVTCRARALFQRKLEGWESSSADNITEFTREFDQTTKLVIESDQEPVYIRVAGRRANSQKHFISSGKLKLSGEEVTTLFNDSVNAIFDAFEQQQKFISTPITTVFLVGGLSMNVWVYSRLQSYFEARNINIYRPANHTSGTVATGAVFSHLGRCDHKVLSEVIERDTWPMNAEMATLEEVAESLGVQEEGSIDKFSKLEKTVVKLREKLAGAATENQSLHSVLRAHEQKHQCEVLYAQGRLYDATEALISIRDTTSEAVRANGLIVGWLAEFTCQCISTLEINGDDALDNDMHDEAIMAYSTALSLGHSAPSTLLIKWASATLARGSANEALRVAANFKLPKFFIFSVICDVLEREGHVVEAIACFQQMENELSIDISFVSERAQWKLDFQRRCRTKLEKLGDAAMDSQNYSEAAEHFSAILSLNTVNHTDILVKRSRARVRMNSWEEALSDADAVIKLDASSHRGYEIRHAALHGARRHAEAVEALDSMLSRLEKSPDENAHQLRRGYVDARSEIRRIIQQTIRPMPQVLIDTTTGRLYDKQQQADAFEALPIYNELVSSMATQLDYARIQETVKEFYRYAMLSHRWEKGEPLLKRLENISIYDLEASPANTKLQEFCSLVRSLGFRWAWSDNSCVDKTNNVVLQESLVAMFTWYRGSSLTVVYLHDVSSESQKLGDLWRSIWNTRAWTYQEYVAAEVIRFYTADWKPYLGLDLPNHKKSPVIISEMQQATGTSAQEMAVLRPGSDRAREKLYLASRREATLTEDIAYSLFGIFNVAIPVIYGEGNRAVGRLLEHILTGSGDVSILAWTGSAGSYNSCLPMDLTVYSSLVPLHVPRPIEKDKMENIIAELCSSLDDFSLVTTLHRRLCELPSPSLTAGRLRLSGIVFPLTENPHGLEPDPQTNLRVYRASTPMLGDVEIKTADNLAGMEGLCLVHPWIRSLLRQEFPRSAVMTTQALRLVVRLRQPFGALLFELLSGVEYRRVAVDSLIMVQIRKEVSLDELISSIRTIEIQ